VERGVFVECQSQYQRWRVRYAEEVEYERKTHLLEVPSVPAMECALMTSVEVQEAGDHCHVGEDVESDQEWQVVYGLALVISTHVRKLETMGP